MFQGEPHPGLFGLHELGSVKVLGHPGGFVVVIENFPPKRLFQGIKLKE